MRSRATRMASKGRCNAQSNTMDDAANSTVALTCGSGFSTQIEMPIAATATADKTATTASAVQRYVQVMSGLREMSRTRRR